MQIPNGESQISSLAILQMTNFRLHAICGLHVLHVLRVVCDVMQGTRVESQSVICIVEGWIDPLWVGDGGPALLAFAGAFLQLQSHNTYIHTCVQSHISTCQGK